MQKGAPSDAAYPERQEAEHLPLPHPGEGAGEHRKGVGAWRRVFSPTSATASLDLHKTENLAFPGEESNFLALFTMADTAECLPSSHSSSCSMLVPDPPIT